MQTRLVGIINLTPDSFSDGGSFTHLEQILTSCTSLINDGASIIDIGAESTRPGADPLSESEEWQRLSPYLKAAIDHIHQLGALASLDSRYPANAERAIGLGIDWINDVTGLNNSLMLDIVAKSNVTVVVMHSVSIPANRDMNIPHNTDPILYLKQWWNGCVQLAQDAGIDKSRLIFDPGLGFGKDFKQCWDVIHRVHEFKTLESKIFIGHSRKGFLAPKKLPTQRDEETFKISAELASQKIDYLRVHNVRGNRIACASADQL